MVSHRSLLTALSKSALVTFLLQTRFQGVFSTQGEVKTRSCDFYILDIHTLVAHSHTHWTLITKLGVGVCVITQLCVSHVTTWLQT